MMKPVPFAVALIPALVLIGLMGCAVWLFGDASAAGPAQIALLAAAGAANIVGLSYGMKWGELEEAVIHSVSRAIPASLILLAVGALIGTWMMSGTAPAMIYYGLGLISPQWFYPAAAIICACVSVSIGSSWTTAGTVGLALVGAATIMGLSPAVTAGAVVGGSYFGDKLSPLSDSTNLASAVVGVNLFDHVRHMLTTTIPSLVIATLIFAGFSLAQGGAAAPVEAIAETRETLKAAYDLGPLTMAPLVVVFVLAIRKFPPYPTIAFGALLGGLVAVIRQPEIVRAFADPAHDLPLAAAMLKGVWQALSTGFQSNLGDAELDRLLTRGGMASMLSIIWMVIAALSFAASMEATGLLEKLTAPLIDRIRGVGSLVMATVFSAIAMNIFSATQYMAIIIPGRMYLKEYKKRGLAPVNLSRTVEDAGTMTSALVPWTTCGVFMAGALGVPTLDYLPFAFVNLLNPILAILYGFFGIALVRKKKAAPEGAAVPA
ncbi:Na+/H+ antiporter NhaC [Hyphococcus luteus]|uniref:Na+/H+ antiporter NhaC n=1 Tax=Hyphococcus luteus TaxID=2058213 RepID=A0A2S7KA33_9PROT|nr:Na+/H+ antiporter NhaC [Marinicaulis flavus]PQA89338.1 Na+/H+ antiporter NhaC [Marinicaulis flavus]